MAAILSIFLCIVAIFAQISASNETDFLSLLDFKNRIQSDPTQFLNSWNDSLHFCDWDGITCDRIQSIHKRVTILDVSSRSLGGTLSPSIGNLTFLREIWLNENSFLGVIPLEIGRLFHLRYLVLANNSFEGRINADLALCGNLKSIDLEGNKLSGRIPDHLSVLPNLLELKLSNNFFNGRIPPSLGNISTLLALHLSLNSLNGNIPHELGKLVNLQWLGLSKNNLSGSIPLSIYNLSSIQVFLISWNSLTGRFPDSLGLTLPKITMLLAASNNLSGSIPSTLANTSDLALIDIGENLFTGPIPRSLGRLHKLQKLLIYNNPLGISKDNDISILAELTNCTNLESLTLSGIEIGGVLPLEISNLSRKLTYLRLDKNHISGSLRVGVGDLVSLSYLDMSSNSLSSRIPFSIGNLQNLKYLFLSDNKFIGEIPPSIGDISGLLALDLYQNMLSGSIPLSISNLTHLLELDLSQNQLNGSFPKEVFSLTSLSIGLFLNQNNFSGTIPSDIGNLKNLLILKISENKLSGEIPQSIGDCLMLTNLEMQGNLLHGLIPSTLGQLISVETMDLSRNNLSGEIPHSLTELKFINFLNLSFNSLEGEVPRNGFFVNTSAFSVVGNRGLCGGNKSLNLPECPSKTQKKSSTHIIVILVIVILIALVSLFGFTYFIYQRRKSGRLTSSTSPYDKKLLKISYAEIFKSTNGFSSENLIGEGRYGLVYRGAINPGEKLIAIKVLKLQLKGAHNSFIAECKVLRNTRHKNLAKIITSCSSIDFNGNDFKALIFEYVPNGSLEEWLHKFPSNLVYNKKLDLIQRLNIAIDIAMALDYLHNNSGNTIVHCDIKPNNILLGDDLRGLLIDFGLAKFLPTIINISRDTESTSIGINGTIGYVPPEYGMGGDLSAKGDVYSYGILLLEMFTGKRPTDEKFTEDYNLHNYVKAALNHCVADIIDPQLLTVKDYEENRSTISSTNYIIESYCFSIFQVGVSCSSFMQNERMDIKHALIKLQHVRNKM